MNRRANTIWIVGIPLALTGGCLGPVRNDYTSSQAISIAPGSTQADTLWRSAQNTLRRYRFRLDRVDRRAGLITTEPVTSQHFFEFWRHDVDTQTDLWEATLNPMRRRVEVQLAQDDGGLWSRLDVVVYKQRYSAQDRQFNSTGAIYQYFGTTLPSTTGEVDLTVEGDAWLDVGRDPAMEDRLMREMLRRLDDQVASSTHGATSK